MFPIVPPCFAIFLCTAEGVATRLERRSIEARGGLTARIYFPRPERKRKSRNGGMAAVTENFRIAHAYVDKCMERPLFCLLSCMHGLHFFPYIAYIYGYATSMCGKQACGELGRKWATFVVSCRKKILLH